MQGPNESISEVLDVGELLVAVVNQQNTGKDAKDQEASVSEKWL